MAITWTFKTGSSTNYKPAIADQKTNLTENILCLRNPWVTDSVFMGKLYTAFVFTVALAFYPNLFTKDTWAPHNLDLIFIAGQALMPMPFFIPLLYRIYCIKRLSGFYFNRITKKIHYQRGKKLITFDWTKTEGGLFKRTEFGGASSTTSYALAFAPRRADGTLHQKDCLWVDSNEPTEPGIKHVAEVWEYLRHFMDHGPDKLPPPGEPNWWYKPLHQICLTPAEAWQHYAPWRTGEPGEMQGKKNWQLPFWAVLFPYNLSVALCWYVICRLFNVRAAPPPPEALEDASVRRGKRK
ncbi:hypothetical protein NJI34_28220 [Pseudomonas sp. S 311-6]|uniref:hypothetical protein n=1 Tax=Pseudomonas TaxID=286 RepID=UPI001CE4065B|nr:MULTISPECIES: hypothetical protein [Pseudomonas]MCO7640661.1 hypothetical protein [Pseudomonas sp. S 311-6]MCO7566014.1 hypothetical protein [Pseudomonas mosselii]MCO7596247.1 hypothetical protein [Pseudomonas guariconensis]MCO7617181.1 hypothetical protein [Pseudomonas guariconensis]MCO7634866.1 hypothetical protein [Pseudomonas guariconensis]